MYDVVIVYILGMVAYAVYHSFCHVFKDHLEAIFTYRLWPRCEHCHTIRGLALEESRTCYSTLRWDGRNFDGTVADLFEDKIPPHKDPNRSVLLCRECAVMHHEYWDDMWKDYYSGRL